MPQFAIEREMPGTCRLRPDELRAASQGSCNILRQLGPDIEWVHCIYRAPSEELIRQHAELAGLPASSIAPVCATIDPTTAE